MMELETYVNLLCTKKRFDRGNVNAKVLSSRESEGRRKTV
jgi:hypothetical protein